MDKGSLTFEPEGHIYRVDGVEKISVTTAISKGGYPPRAYFTEEGKIRGKAVHTGVFLDIDDDLDRSNLHPMIEGYLRGWFKFRAEARFVPIRELCELPQWNHEHDYVGTPDVVGYLNGKAMVCDVKTGDSSTARYQVTAYSQFPLIAALAPTINRYGLSLRPEGTYRLDPYQSHNDWPPF